MFSPIFQTGSGPWRFAEIGGVLEARMTDKPDAPEPGGDRIAKVLARAGIASRRDVEKLIAEGRVKIDGAVLTTPAFKPAPGAIIMVDNKVVGGPEPTRLWRYYKPVGLVTSHRDEKGRGTVFEHLPPNMPRVISIGRLDTVIEAELRQRHNPIDAEGEAMTGHVQP